MSHPSSKKAKQQRAAREKARRERTEADRLASAARREMHEKEHEQRVRSRTKHEQYRRWGVVGLVVVAVAGTAFLIFQAVRPGPELAGVERPDYLGRGHIENAAYPTATPTSGAHDSRSPACTAYQEELPGPLAVHALEHGTVVIWYDAARPELGVELADLMNDWDSHVIVTPSAQLSEPIVATAWRRLKRYDSVDADLREFVDIYRNRGPEQIGCDIT